MAAHDSDPTASDLIGCVRLLVRALLRSMRENDDLKADNARLSEQVTEKNGIIGQFENDDEQRQCPDCKRRRDEW
jgi:hypothetical protein